MAKKIIIIGAGFSGLSAACHLAKKGCQVTILEKNAIPGGRARKLEANGFTFDMGPSWYWMPEVFEDFFAAFGKKVSDYYQLTRLDPGYRIRFSPTEFIDIPADTNQQIALFESLEPGSGEKLISFLKEARYKYEMGMHEFVKRPSLSVFEFVDIRIMKAAFRMQLLQSMAKHVRKHFSHPFLIKLMEFPVLFLGAIPENTPALYSMMNYADLTLGTWYPMGGMYKVIEGMVKLAEELGVKILYNHEVRNFKIKDKQIEGVIVNDNLMEADLVVASADYHHVDADILKDESNYSEKYWNSRVFAPSALMFFLGINRKVKSVIHHELFFDKDFSHHASDIYTNPKWPTEPLFYTSFTSKTDSSVAPQGCENLVVLIPIAPDLKDTPETREKYLHLFLERFEKITGESIEGNIIFNQSYCINDFKNDYNAYKGNAYGLANTIMQTAFLKPKLRHKKIRNLFYTGQLTTPGPGVPPCIISGEVVATLIHSQI